MKKTYFYCLLIVLFLPSAYAEEKLRIAILYQHPVNAGGWSQSHEQARLAIDDLYGGKVETAIVENVTPGPDTIRVLTRLSREGYDMIFATSFGHMNPVARVARQFPGVIFEHASGYKRAKNVGNYQIRASEGRYLSGRLAGAMSATGKLGYVGAFPIPEVVRGINAFTLGAKAINPDATVQVIWINSWSDPSKERDAAGLLIDAGVDLITHHTETPSIAVAAEQADIYFIGYQYDRSAFAPTKHLATVEHNWLPLYQASIDARLAGQWESTDLWMGLESDATRLVGLSDDIPDEVHADMAATRAAIIAGDKVIFAGPLISADGVQMATPGETLSWEAVSRMEWFVGGVLENH